MTDRTNRLYAQHASRFAEWCRWQGLSWTSTAELDVMLTAFLGHLALDGFDTATGRVTIAALRHFVPGLGGGRASLPRASRALDGWKKLKPPTMRLPLPRPAIMAVLGVLLSRGQVEIALFILMSFAAYLRPSEAARLQGHSLAPPNTASGAAYAE